METTNKKQSAFTMRDLVCIILTAVIFYMLIFSDISHILK